MRKSAMKQKQKQKHHEILKYYENYIGTSPFNKAKALQNILQLYSLSEASKFELLFHNKK